MCSVSERLPEYSALDAWVDAANRMTKLCPVSSAARRALVCMLARTV